MRRLVWTIVDGPYSHHNGSAQIIRERDNRTRFVWITDVLPGEHADSLDPLMERGISPSRRRSSRPERRDQAG